MAGPLRADEGFRPSYRPAPPPRRGVDPEMQRLGLMALAVGGGIALLVSGASLLRGGHKSLPVIEAQAGPVRIKPLDPGGLKVTGAELSTGVNGEGQQLMPAPEQPELRALKAQVREMQKQLARQAAATAAAVKLAQAQAAAQAAAKAAAQAAAQPVAKSAPTKLASATPMVTAAGVSKASATAVIERPVPPPALAPVLPLPSDPPGLGTQVQLGAFKDEAAARQKWAELVHDLPEILGGRVPDIAAASAAGQTLWRLRTGDFTDVAQAASFCQQLKAKSVACNVAAF